MTYLGLAVGPSLGGWLTEMFTWRSVFYVNVPIGAAAVLAGMCFIPATSERGRRQFDFLGAAVFMGGLAVFLIGLNRGHNWGWASWQVLSLLAVSLLLLASFILVETRTVASDARPLVVPADRIFGFRRPPPS